MIIWAFGKLSPGKVEALTDEFIEISDELNIVRHAMMSQTVEFPSRNIGVVARKWSTLMERYRVRNKDYRKVLMGLRSNFPVRDTEARNLEKAQKKAADETRRIQETILLHDPGVNQAIREITEKAKPEEEARNAILISGEPAWGIGNHPVAIIVRLRTDGDLLQTINNEIRIDRQKHLAKLLFVRMLNPAEKIENLYFMAENYNNDLMHQSLHRSHNHRTREQYPHGPDLNDIETFIDAAKQHGLDSEPDHEVGDLQQMLRTAWEILTPAQRRTFSSSEPAQETLEMGGVL